jgi:hypothetical protein
VVVRPAVLANAELIGATWYSQRKVTKGMAYYKVCVDKRQYLHVQLYGVRNRQNACHIVDDVEQAIMAGPHRLVLLDVRGQDAVATGFNTYEQASYAAARLSQLKPKIAYLSKEEDFEDARYWETVAVNRGLWLRLFHEETDARQWLLEGAVEEA